MHLQYKNTKQNIQAVQKRARHVAPHLHNTLELVYVTEGTLELGVGQELYHLETGDMGIIFPNIIHHYQVFGADAHKIYLVNIAAGSIGFFGEELQKYASDQKERTGRRGYSCAVPHDVDAGMGVHDSASVFTDRACKMCTAFGSG